MTIKMNYWNLKCAGLTACFTFCVQFIFCQILQTITDKKDILIGEQISIKIKAVLPSDGNQLSKWISLPDSIPHFEIVETGKTETVDYKDNSKAVEQTIIFTSFDSGKWVFPALSVEFTNAAGQPVQKLQTDSFLVNVSYSPPDSTNQLRDIKPIMGVSITDYTWYYIIGGILLLLIIIVLVIRYLKKNKKTKPERSASGLTAYNEAMADIKNLAQYNLHNAEEVKIYHTKLSAIFKNYLGRKQGKNLFNRTASDLLIRMTENSMTVENVSNLATALRCSDAVKFAKYLPAVEESEDCATKIKETINLIETPKLLN